MGNIKEGLKNIYTKVATYWEEKRAEDRELKQLRNTKEEVEYALQTNTAELERLCKKIAEKDPELLSRIESEVWTEQTISYYEIRTVSNQSTKSIKKRINEMKKIPQKFKNTAIEKIEEEIRNYLMYETLKPGTGGVIKTMYTQAYAKLKKLEEKITKPCIKDGDIPTQEIIGAKMRTARREILCICSATNYSRKEKEILIDKVLKNFEEQAIKIFNERKSNKNLLFDNRIKR